MKKIGAYLMIVLILLMLSCSASQMGWKAESDTEGKIGEKRNLLEDFDPLSLNDDDIVITPVLRTSTTNNIVRREQETRIINEERSEDEMVQGYRVQLLATDDEFNAREAKKNAIFRFEEGVYLVFEAPHYRLRIGDCQTRSEAEALREKAIRNGFRDAWIVPSKIFPQRGTEIIR